MIRKLTAICLTLMTLCAGSAMAQELTVTDMKGRDITLSEPVTRIVALTAADCEIVCALGGEELLVGRGAYCNYPESIASLPVVQSGADTNIEEILALQPQIVLMNEMAQTIEQTEMLEAAGVHAVVSEASDIEGVYYAIRMIGSLMGKDTEAEALVGDMQTAFADIAAKSKPTGSTVYFEVSPLQWGLWTAGANTFMDELATICGLTNAFSDVDGWAEISEEQVLARDPDYIVTNAMYYGEGATPVEEIISRPGWQQLQAVTNNHVLNIDADEVSRPGPRLVNAATALYEFISEAFEPAA